MKTSRQLQEGEKVLVPMSVQRIGTFWVRLALPNGRLFLIELSDSSPIFQAEGDMPEIEPAPTPEPPPTEKPKKKKGGGVAPAPAPLPLL